MARDWTNTDKVREDIFALMARHGDNTAVIPFSETYELRGKKLLWVIDIHVRVIRTNEFDVTAEAPSLNDALRSAYLSLSREPVRS